MGATHALKALLVEAAMLPLITIRGRPACQLLEDNANYSFMIRNLPKDTIVIKSEQFPSLKDIFLRVNIWNVKEQIMFWFLSQIK